MWLSLAAVLIAHKLGFIDAGRAVAGTLGAGYILYVSILLVAAIMSRKIEPLKKYRDGIVMRLTIHAILIAFVAILYLGSRGSGGYLDTDCRPAGPGIYNDC